MYYKKAFQKWSLTLKSIDTQREIAFTEKKIKKRLHVTQSIKINFLMKTQIFDDVYKKSMPPVKKRKLRMS